MNSVELSDAELVFLIERTSNKINEIEEILNDGRIMPDHAKDLREKRDMLEKLGEKLLA
jgi:hypothetical protein